MPEPTTQQIIDAHKESITHWEHNLKTFPRHQQIDWLFFNGMTSSCPLCTIFLTAQSDCAGCSLDDQLVAGCAPDVAGNGGRYESWLVHH